MNKRQLMFVTYQDESSDEGFSYAVELAKAMAEDIVLLLVPKKDTFARKFDDLMAGVTFAEAGMHETAKDITASKSGPATGVSGGKITEMVLAASKAGIHLEVRHTDKDLAVGIRSFIKAHSGIDKVVLSPSVTESEMLTTRDLNRLVRTASRPIVTMTRQAVQATQEFSQNA